jgi:Protein of unknown function (DUF1236)
MSMKFTGLRAATAVALVLSATAAYAQMPQKEQAPEAAPRDKGPQVQQQERAPDTGGKAATQNQEEPKASRGADKAAPKDKASKGTAQKDTEPKEKATKGSAQKDVEPKEKATKGTAQKDTEPKDKATKGAAQKGDATKEKSASDKASPSDSTAGKAGTQPHAQLSDQQQTRVRETVLKQRGNRVTNVNFSVTIGTRVPRSVRLAPLPATVIEIVPEYRTYHYVVVRDDIVFVDPVSYEIVYVLPGRSTTAGGGGATALALTDEQIAFVVRNIDLKSESRLGIGGITVGSTVGREVELREFPALVVEKLPELRSYRYLVHENDVAFVDSNNMKVVLVKDSRQ